jgi:hypothetical protein
VKGLILSGSRIAGSCQRDLAGRVVDSLIGRHVRIARARRLRMPGDYSEVSLR